MHVIKLQPPGAGIPLMERLIGKIAIFYSAARTRPEESLARFTREQHQLLSLVNGLSEGDRARPVCIKRLRGLEDSSRNWSPYMILDHLRIVNSATLQSIQQLVRGQQPDITVRIQDVKPSEILETQVITQFNQVCEDYKASIPPIQHQLNTQLRLAHPWFGSMNAGQWHYMMAFHMQLHRKQLEAVVQHRA